MELLDPNWLIGLSLQMTPIKQFNKDSNIHVNSLHQMRIFFCSVFYGFRWFKIGHVNRQVSATLDIQFNEEH